MSNITQTELERYTPHLKDMLARYYKFIDRFKDNQTTHKVIDFTEQGVRMAIMNQSIDGQCDQKFLDKFISNLDMMKKIADEQPIYRAHFKVMYREPIQEGNNTRYEETYKIETEDFVGYDEGEVTHKIHLSSKVYRKLQKTERIN